MTEIRTRRAPTMDLPPPVAQMVDTLAALPGAVAVVLGGSRVTATNTASSDWDLGLYYRGTIDLTALAAYGTVFPPGSWGRIMNGGAWLQCGGEKVDVLLRDLDTVDHWTAKARDGVFERDALLGYVAGIPTYSLCAELASCQPLRGDVEAVPFPAKLAEAAPDVWRFCRTFSLDYARAHARRGQTAGVVGQAATALMCEAHAVVCARGEWICNEKHLVAAAGLDRVNALFAEVPAATPAGLAAWVDRVAAQLGAASEAAPWNARTT